MMYTGKQYYTSGQYYPSEALPWHYLPVWIGISTPIIILAGFVIGIGEWIRSTILFFQGVTDDTLKKIGRWVSNPDTLPWLAVAGWLVIPIISIYLFHSVLYNGWRHLFFIYPPIVLFSVRGFSAFHKWLSQLTGRFAPWHKVLNSIGHRSLDWPNQPGSNSAIPPLWDCLFQPASGRPCSDKAAVRIGLLGSLI